MKGYLSLNENTETFPAFFKNGTYSLTSPITQKKIQTSKLPISELQR